MLNDKYPMKTKTDIEKMLDSIKNGVIEEVMWTKILERMYEERDAEELEIRIRNVIEERSKLETQSNYDTTGGRNRESRQ